MHLFSQHLCIHSSQFSNCFSQKWRNWSLAYSAVPKFASILFCGNELVDWTGHQWSKQGNYRNNYRLRGEFCFLLVLRALRKSLFYLNILVEFNKIAGIILLLIYTVLLEHFQINNFTVWTVSTSQEYLNCEKYSQRRT